MDVMTKEVWLVVLGAALALTTSVVMEFFRSSVTQRRVRALLSGLLRDEIEMISDILKDLADDTQKLGYIPLIRLNDIVTARQGFDRNRDWVILYRDENLRRHLFNFYREVGREGSRATMLENGKTNTQITSQPGWQNYYERERDDIVLKCRDMATRGQMLVTELKSVKRYFG